jgi:hypothetical protein
MSVSARSAFGRNIVEPIVRSVLNDIKAWSAKSSNTAFNAGGVRA